MTKNQNLLICSLFSITAALAPLSAAHATVPGLTVLPFMEAQLDTSTESAENDYSSMTKKDCAALKKHKSDYSEEEYKDRMKYCKSLRKHKHSASNSTNNTDSTSSNTGNASDAPRDTSNMNSSNAPEEADKPLDTNHQ